MRCLGLLSVVFVALLCIAANTPVPQTPARGIVVAAGSANCAAVTNNPTTDTEIGTWTAEPVTAPNYFSILDEGRGVASPADSEYIYMFDAGTADTDTLRFTQPDGSCNITNIAITAMCEASANTPGVAMRVSQDNSTWTAYITNALAAGPPATEEAFNFGAVSWTAPTDIYVQIKTTTANFDVARVVSIQALVNIAP